MSFNIKEFATVRIFSNEVEKSRDWYREFLGIEPAEDIEGFVSFKIASVCFDISAADIKSPHSTGGAVGYWLVDDLEKAIIKAQELGGRIYRGPLKVDESQRIIAQIIDPFGNVFGLECEF